jgi:hypothetical protein
VGFCGDGLHYSLGGWGFREEVGILRLTLTGKHERVRIDVMQRYGVWRECWMMKSFEWRGRLGGRGVFHDEFEKGVYVTFSAGRMKAVTAEAEGGDPDPTCAFLA